MSASRSAELRAAVARIVANVVGKGRSIDRECQKGLAEFSKTEQALAREIAFGSVRWYVLLQAVVEHMTGKPAGQIKAPIRALLIGGLYQLWKMRIAEHAVVSETVSALYSLQAPRLKGLLNALLRRFQRERDTLFDQADIKSACHAHPKWLYQAIQADWPDKAESIFQNNNARAPMCLRVNQQKTTLQAFKAQLREKFDDNKVSISDYLADGLLLEKPVAVSDLPGWQQGLVSVQDGAAQLAADFLDAKPGQRVLDACAAPGGKSAHLLERSKGAIDLTALDVDPRRLGDVQQTLDRLGLQGSLIAADAQLVDSWWDGKPFDRILIDAPCSASGVIRRHPDIKFTRRPADIARLAATQRGLLTSLWPLLSPGGRLVYATCSIFSRENCSVVNDFVQDHSNASVTMKLPKKDWQALMIAGGRGHQVLPGSENFDGFYYACLEKTL